MSPRAHLLQIILSTFLAFCIISFFFSGNNNFENLALGTETVTWLAKDKLNSSIHVVRIDEQEETAFLNGWN